LIATPFRRRIDIVDCSSLSNFGYIVLDDQNPFAFSIRDDGNCRDLKSFCFLDTVIESWELPIILSEFGDSCVSFRTLSISD
jgi:hypothetical protein